MRGHIVGGKTDELDTPRGEIGVRESNGGEFRGADGSVVVRVGEEDGPRPVEPVVELSPKLVTPRKQVWKERERRKDGMGQLELTLMRPCVVSASKSGAISPSRRDIFVQEIRDENIGYRM